MVERRVTLDLGVRRVSLFFAGLFTGLSFLAPTPVSAKSDGITSISMPNPPANCTGAGCHQAASPDVFVEISGPNVLSAGEIGADTPGVTRCVEKENCQSFILLRASRIAGTIESTGPAMKQRFAKPSF